MTSNVAIFLDRDGTLIRDMNYPRDPDGVRLLPGVADALARLREAGFMSIVVSNQSGVGRGIVTREQADAVHARFVAELAAAGIQLDGAFYCPHAPADGCSCRKPSAELIFEAARNLNIDLSRSFVVGDKPSDVETGRRAGCRTILLAPEGTAPHEPSPDLVARTWRDVVRYVLRERAGAAA